MVTSSPRAVASAPKLTYLPGLDGIRAIAIVAVLLYHGGVTWLSGGFLGVDIFFVLSGFLITSLLVNELAKTRRLDFRAFYRGRARRLLPAFLLMAFAVFTYALFFMKDSVASTLRDLPWALGGLSNWWLVFHQQSYFESIGRPLLLQHTWSLAVEVQFYLIWPLLVLFAVPRIGVRGVGVIALVLAALSCAIMYWLSTPFDTASSVSRSHMYFGTDSHSMGLFLGAALATLWRPASRSEGVPQGLSALSVAVVLVYMLIVLHLVNEYTGQLYQAGFPLASGLAVLLIALAVHPSLAVGRYLAVLPLRWIGERSYGMYLWHWPIFQATRPGIDIALTGFWNLLFRVALTVIVAELSYRYLEVPVRRGALGRLWKEVRAWHPLALRGAAVGAIAAAVALFAVEGRLAAFAIDASAASAASFEPLVVPVSAATTQKRAASKKLRHLTPELAAARVALQTPALLLGDSVLLGTSRFIANRVNVVKVDATVARQAKGMLQRTTEMAQARKLPPTVILNLGNNGTVEETTLRSILRQLKRCRNVVVINARVPRQWQDDNNALMARVVPQFRNAVLADWKAASDGRPDYFAADGVHPNLEGARVYADVVARALKSRAHAKRVVVAKRG